ncbi:HD domain-containing protein [Erwinia sp. JUb26]|uniref:HD domain-containing protein n=1 Tax=Erwinia sp. JUb26 TaxID=2485126 RepID=UPI000F47020E|nr:HD domain-containing protein [Erwinia sp. JUb26]ROR13254.1 putative hydrolase of HD superfamily [Erwinia sp. JUb26]
MSDRVAALDFGAMTEVVQFLMELDKLKSVERRTRLLDNARQENSAEHSWHLAMAAMSLAPFATEAINVPHAVQLALVHDVVEIDAGDVLVYDLAAREAVQEQEMAAAERIFGLLPAAQSQQFRALWNEYEDGDTAESRFANMLDRALPIMLNLHNEGQSWKENGIRLEQVKARNVKLAEQWPELWGYLQQHLDNAHARGWLL